MKTLYLSLLVVLLLSGCSSQAAQHAIEDDGYTNVKIGGYVWMACGKDDWIGKSRHFTADRNGKTTEGYACCGMFLKGCTIRH